MFQTKAQKKRAKAPRIASGLTLEREYEAKKRNEAKRITGKRTSVRTKRTEKVIGESSAADKVRPQIRGKAMARAEYLEIEVC